MFETTGKDRKGLKQEVTAGSSCEEGETLPIETRPFSLTVDGLVLRGEVTSLNRQPPRPPLIICHGIPQERQAPTARNEGYRFLAAHFARLGFKSIIFNFRGTGFSEGSFDLWGWKRDLEAVMKWALQEVGPEGQPLPLSLLGFSGGAATACIAAAGRREAAHVILAACPADFDFLFDRQPAAELLEEARSIGIVKEADLPKSPRDWVREQKKFRPVDYVSRISPRSLLLIHGLKDELVIAEHSRRLYAAAGEPKELILLPEALHQLRTLPEVWGICYRWLKKRVRLVDKS